MFATICAAFSCSSVAHELLFLIKFFERNYYDQIYCLNEGIRRLSNSYLSFISFSSCFILKSNLCWRRKQNWHIYEDIPNKRKCLIAHNTKNHNGATNFAVISLRTFFLIAVFAWCSLNPQSYYSSAKLAAFIKSWHELAPIIKLFPIGFLHHFVSIFSYLSWLQHLEYHCQLLCYSEIPVLE